MTIDAKSGPSIDYGITVSTSGAVGEYNEHRGPSLLDLGQGILDPRAQYGYGYQPGQGATTQSYGFWDNQAVVDYIPGTISSNNIALTQVPANGTALTLAASGVTTTSLSCIVCPETAKVSTGNLICIDSPCGGSSAAAVTFGSAGSISIWNPATLGSRCIAITGSSQNDGGMYWSIAGRDSYGFKMTEQLAGSTAGSTGGAITLVSKKAYKYIAGIVPVNSTGTLGSTNVIVGTADTYGFPFLVQHAAYVSLWLGNPSSATQIGTAGTNYTYGSSLPTATSTNGDVRGTYASSVASSTGSGTRVTMFVSPTIGVAAAALSSYSGLNQIGASAFYNYFGATQYSSI